jgi:hypothetical protein
MFNFKLPLALLACTLLSGCVIIIDQTEGAPSKYSAHVMKGGCPMHAKDSHSTQNAQKASQAHMSNREALIRAGVAPPPPAAPGTMRMTPPSVSQPAPVSAPKASDVKPVVPGPHCGAKTTAAPQAGASCCGGASAKHASGAACSGCKDCASGGCKAGSSCGGCKECQKHKQGAQPANSSGHDCPMHKAPNAPAPAPFTSKP